MSDLVLRSEDLFENPSPRVPVVLCLDTSGSMAGEPIQELIQGALKFYQEIYDDEIARYSAEIAIITFGGGVDVVTSFGPVERHPQVHMEATGLTPMGEAVLKALELLDQRKSMYRDAGVDYFQPWLVLMTDGVPTDSIGTAVQRTTNLVKQKKLSVFPVGIGSQADLNVLGSFAGGRQALRLKGLKFQQFFVWLSKSIQRVSASTPGESVPLDTGGIGTWGTV